jgi:hypothetical protein
MAAFVFFKLIEAFDSSGAPDQPFSCPNKPSPQSPYKPSAKEHQRLD